MLFLIKIFNFNFYTYFKNKSYRVAQSVQTKPQFMDTPHTLSADNKSIHSIDMENYVSLPPQRPPPPMHLDSNFKESPSNSSGSSKSQSRFKNVIRSNSIELDELPGKSNSHQDRLSHSTSLGSLESHKNEQNGISSNNGEYNDKEDGSLKRSNNHSLKGDEKIKAFSNEILSSIESLEKAVGDKNDDNLKNTDFSINDYLNKYSFSSIDDEVNNDTIQKSKNKSNDENKDVEPYKSETVEIENEVKKNEST